MDILHLCQQYKHHSNQNQHNQILAVYIQVLVYQVHDILPFSAPIIESLSNYDSSTVSMSTTTPHSPLIVAPTKDTPTPLPTIKTDNYGIYVNLPAPLPPNTTPPLVHQTSPTTFTQLHQIIFITRIFCIYFDHYIQYLIHSQQVYIWSTHCIFMATFFKYHIYLFILLERCQLLFWIINNQL